MTGATDTLKTQPSLLSKVRKGDEDGWSRFYEFYEGFVYSAARASGLSHEVSRDVLQEAMLTIRNYIGQFVPDNNRGRFRTWLRRIIRSRIADQYRVKARNPLEKRPDEIPMEDSATTAISRLPNLDEVELDRIIDGKLEQAILNQAREWTKRKVRIEDYQTYDLFEVQQLSAREASASLGIAAPTVRVRSLRVRRAVEREIRRIIRLMETPKLGH